MLNRPKFFNYFLVILFVDVGDYVADTLVRFEILTNNVDAVGSQYLVDLSKDTRHVAVNMN